MKFERKFPLKIDETSLQSHNDADTLGKEESIDPDSTLQPKIVNIRREQMVTKKSTFWFKVVAFIAPCLFATVLTASAQTSVSSCQLLPTGNYVLTKNITASGTCFTITGPNVAIDFKGHTLTGDGSGDGITDAGFERDFAVISNGKITNFSNGINLRNSGSATINKMTLLNNVNHGLSIDRCCNTLNSVKANNNGSDGVSISECCNTTTGSQANNNGGDGFDMIGCCSTVENSTANNNHNEGLDLFDCCSFATDDKVNGNGGDGIFMDSCCNGVINTVVSGSGGNGVELLSDDNLVVKSKSNKNGGSGFVLSNDTDNQITNSQANGNHATGTSIRCPGNVVMLSANGNSAGNLVTSGGTCTQLNNKTP